MSKSGPKPVFRAAVNGSAEEIKSIIRKIVDHKEPSGRTPLMQAAIHGRNRVLEQLLVFGATPDIGDNDDNTALHEACQGSSLETVSILLEYGADVMIKNKDGDTPLHLAAHSCNLEVVELLLNEGADVTVKNNQRMSAKDKLQSTPKSISYNEADAEAIITLIQDWRIGKGTKSKRHVRSIKETNVESLKEIKESVNQMNTSVMTLLEKIDYLGNELRATTQKLQVTEELANRYERQLKDLTEGVTGMQNDLKKSGEATENKLTKLIKVTESIYDNLCSDTNFNDRVFHKIFSKIAQVVGSKKDCWKELAKNLFANYNQTYVNDQINQVQADFKTESERAYECLLRWKVIVATQVHKLDPLQKIIRSLDITQLEMDSVCNEIENIMDQHHTLVNQEPTGSLSEKGLIPLSKELGRSWREVGLQLEFTNAYLDTLKENYPDAFERNHQMLLKWSNREPGFNDTKLGRLVEALKSSGRVDLAESLTL